jgi:hypothetical protein
MGYTVGYRRVGRLMKADLKIKKDNMMLSSKELVWCPECQAERPETRDVAGRLEAIRHEQMGYPQSFTEPPVRSSLGG